MSHIVESCPLTKLNGGLFRLRSADEEAVSWLTTYGSWNAYEKKITDILVRAHRHANLIHRCFVSRNVTLLLRAILTYFRPLLKYNSVVWSLYHKYDIVAIENVQCRFRKRLPGFANYCYSEPSSLLNLPRLELRRLRTYLFWCYKSIFGRVDILLYSPYAGTKNITQ